MLQSISIRNFILIDELDLVFQRGLCVFTGDTGAGKSILLKALLFCLNAKQNANIIKSGANLASVAAIFDLNENLQNNLHELQIEYEDQLIIKRIQTIDNKSKFFINDQLVSAKTVSRIADDLFELHGQHGHTTLLNPSSHLEILDHYGDLNKLKHLVYLKYQHIEDMKCRLNTISSEIDDINNEIDYLKFVTQEVSDMNIQQGEEDELTYKRQLMQSRDKKLQLLNDLLSQITNPEIYTALNRALRIIARNNDEPRLANLYDPLNDAYNKLDDIKFAVKAIIDDILNSEYDLDRIEERLFAIKAISRKYKIMNGEFEQFLIDTKNELSILQNKLISNDKLTQEIQMLEQEYLALATTLSDKRKLVAKNLEEKMHNELSLLKMSKVVFKIDITEKNNSNNGIDTIRFVASTNPGMPLCSIDKVASGGELARFMLAFKTALLDDKSTIQSVIFDEIDVGVSGVVADSIGARLQQLARFMQVIVITHQPQVAAKADQHIFVSKIQYAESTTVQVKVLSEDERTHAIAQMISGAQITDNSINAASDLRKLSQTTKITN